MCEQCKLKSAFDRSESSSKKVSVARNFVYHSLVDRSVTMNKTMDAL